MFFSAFFELHTRQEWSELLHGMKLDFSDPVVELIAHFASSIFYVRDPLERDEDEIKFSVDRMSFEFFGPNMDHGKTIFGSDWIEPNSGVPKYASFGKVQW